jgi:hypothetical protein
VIFDIGQHIISNVIDMPLRVNHFSPGTRKWNKIEHRLFSFISINWRCQPSVKHESIVNLFTSTTTKKGMKVRTELDSHRCPRGVEVKESEFKAIQIDCEESHGEWNYSIPPEKS